MKKLILSLMACFVITISVHSQNMEGSYANTWESNAGGALTYTLILNPDSTFRFVLHRVYESEHPSDEEIVTGTWIDKNRLLILSTEDSSDENELIKNLNDNRARFKAYSPRHKNYGKVKPSLKFFKSKVFYAKGMKLFKQDSVTQLTGSQ